MPFVYCLMDNLICVFFFEFIDYFSVPSPDQSMPCCTYGHLGTLELCFLAIGHVMVCIQIGIILESNVS